MIMQLRKHFHRNYLYITGIICSSIWFMALPGRFAALLAAMAIAALLIYYRCYRETAIFFLALLLGSTSTLYHTGKQKNLRNLRLENTVVKIVDRNARGAAETAGETLPYAVTARVIQRPDLGNIQLYFPRKMPNPGVDLNCTYKISGNYYPWQPDCGFYRPDASGSLVDVSNEIRNNSYQHFMQRQNISGRAVVSAIEPITPPDPHGKHLSFLTRTVRQIEQKLVGSIKNQDHQAILSAITLGYRGRLTGEMKKDFKTLGISHLFSISGLHIGVLACLLLLLVRPLPLIWHWLLTGTLLLYVLAVGGNAPAMRAFCMVLGIEFFRAMLLKINALEFLSMICAAFLLINPFYLTDAGFIYSFVITAYLITAAGLIGEISRSAMGPARWLGKQSFFRKIIGNYRGALTGGLFFSLVAALASAPLTLLFQDLFFAGSMLINFMILPILLPLFVCSLGKVIFVHPHWLWDNLIKLMLDYMQWCVEFFCRIADASPVMHISWITAVIFLILLLILLQTRSCKYFVITASLLMLTGASVFYRSTIAPERVDVVITGASIQTPMAAIMLPRMHEMYLLNCSHKAVYPLLNIAATYGINRIVRLDIGRPVKDCVSGIGSLKQAITIEKIRTSSTRVRSKVYRELTRDLGKLPTGAVNNSLSISGNDQEALQLVKSDNGGIYYISRGQRLYIPRSSRMQVVIIEN